MFPARDRTLEHVKNAAVLQGAHLVGTLIRLSGRGGGTALPGLLVERTAPSLIPALAAQLSEGIILVTGTNGKTTTARLIGAMLEQAGYRVVQNRAGSNLLRGIAATLVEQAAKLSGRAVGKSYGLFEVDEATLPEAVRWLQPRLLVVLNLFRDQLDRYGEVDAIARLWREGLADLPAQAQVVLNADDPLVASLGQDLGEGVRYYGLEDRSHSLPEQEHAADFVECFACGIPYHYSLTFYGHLGHYRCPQCGWGRPAPAVQGIAVKLHGLAGSETTVHSESEAAAISSDLPGLYNGYNLVAAAAAITTLGLPLAAVPAGVKNFSPAFGRAERFALDEKPVVLLLAKNPVGANQVLRTLLAESQELSLLISLNDRTADGEDISWIWDVDFEALSGHVKWVVASGRRAEDMALRLKYAGWFEGAAAGPAPTPRLMILPDSERALRTAAYYLTPGEALYVVATYTAMLDLRRTLTRMGVLRPFWEEAP